MIYTNSSLTQYNRCPRKYYFNYVEKINPEGLPLGYQPSDALMIGRHVHQLLAGEEVEDRQQDRIEIAKVMKNGLSTARDMLLDDFEVIEAEKELGSTLEKFKIAGKIDGIASYKNKKWVLDYKTSRRMLKRPEKYRLKQQFNLYTMLAEAHGYNVAGVLIVYLRRPSLYRRKGEGIEDYCDRVIEDILDRLDDYYSLVVIPRQTSQIEEVRNSILNCLYHMGLDETLNYYRRSSNHCDQWGTLCKFAPICRGEVRIDECQRRKKIHNELEEDITFQEDL